MPTDSKVRSMAHFLYWVGITIHKYPKLDQKHGPTGTTGLMCMLGNQSFHYVWSIADLNFQINYKHWKNYLLVEACGTSFWLLHIIC